ncbi:MAG: hypothetical protein E7406_00695 [Ruminococcaceae bacterium]|nr:hypothetical protein [Oscillospiraceae bacterium]
MKNKRILSIAVLMCLLINICAFSSIVTVSADNNAMDADIFKGNSENAYVLLDKQIEENKCEFFDGMEMGISDTANPLYNEVSQENGINGRKFYAANFLSVKLDKSFASAEDTEFLITIVYYDYGPKQGRFFLEYFDESGNQQTKTIIKPGNIQRFNAETVYVSSMDVNKAFEDTGATLRIRTNGQNLFKRVEVINLSKFKREGKPLSELTAIPSDTSLDELVSLGIVDETLQKELSANMSENATIEKAYKLLSIISGDENKVIPAEVNGSDSITQGKILELYLEALDITSDEKGAVECALEKGLIDKSDLFFGNDVPACNYNLVELVYNALYFAKSDGTSMMEGLLAKDFFSEQVLKSDESLIALTYKYPKKVPYQTIRENETGQSYYYMNICNIPTIRTYVTAQSWTNDGKSFVCGFQSGRMFLYNTETQMLVYIDQTSASTQLNAVVGTDDYIYYVKTDAEGNQGLWKANLKEAPIKPEFICNSVHSYSLGLVHITNDCKYISAEMYAPGNTRESISGRYSIDEQKWVTYRHPTFPYSPARTHDIINPEYPNIMAFCHEITGVGAINLYDRIWQVDLDTMTAQNVFKQGTRQGAGSIALQGATHEIWSINGEYMYFITYDMREYNQDPIGASPAVVRFDKDGSHRKYYYTKDSVVHENKHCAPSGDDKYVVADGDYVVIISTETWETFPISRYEWNGKTSHPYHGHAVIARNHYKVNWGGQDKYGMLGVKWFDFTELVSSQAKGGYYNMGENVTRASYEGLECESGVTNIKGKEAIYAKSGKSIFVDISEDLIDTDNGKIKLSFDYLDNGTMPIDIIYTSGVNTDNDRYRIFDNKESIVRTGTNRWKHAEVVIYSGNFEDIGKFNTDLKINGQSAYVYLSNVKATIVE